MEKRAVNRKVRKSIAIIGEGLTEYRYVDDIRTTERYRFSLAPGIPKHSDADDIVRLAQERLRAGYDYVLCLIDMDVIESNHEKMEHYRTLKREKSSPCTEYWFLMHYMPGPSSKEYADYDAVAQALRRHMRTKFLKLVYPNDVTLILPGDISASQLEQYINITV